MDMTEVTEHAPMHRGEERATEVRQRHLKKEQNTINSVTQHLIRQLAVDTVATAVEPDLISEIFLNHSSAVALVAVHLVPEALSVVRTFVFMLTCHLKKLLLV